MQKLLLFIFFFISSVSVFATHNRAGEITYKHIPPSSPTGSKYRYGITITTYSNTIATTADRCELTIYLGDGDSAIAPRINGTSTLCPGTADGVMINGKTKLNIYYIEHDYRGPGGATNGVYRITMEDPNRNAMICNIPNSVNASFFLTTELVINPFFPTGNNSPTLLNPPLDDACLGECFEHNPGAYDIDGDSLAYSIVPCYANGAPIPGYSLPPNFNLNSIDPLKGDIVWCTPNKICQYNIAILIKEYKLLPGTSLRYYVGSVLRDMQIDVASCNNQPPIIADIHDTCVVAGSNLNFTVKATDVNNNLLTLTATGGPFQLTPSATFTSTPSTSPVTGNFSWTTSCDQIQLLPYLVTFKVTDNHPTNTLVNFESVFIKVIAPPPGNLTATPSGASVTLNWTASACSSITGLNPLLGYKIYRKNACDSLPKTPCETGISPASGYTLIGTTATSVLTFTDNDNGQGLIHGVDYSYAVVAYYTDGSQSYASSNVCVHLVRDVPIITNVSVATTDAANGSIWIHWVKPLGLNGNLDTIANPGPYEYRLMQAQGMNGSLTYTQVASYTYSDFWKLTDTGFVSMSLNTFNFPYTYRVDFYSNNLLKGSTHTASSVFLTSTPADNKVNLTWTALVPWINYKYFIYKETVAGSGTFNLIDSSSTQSYVDTGLTNGVNYCYKVKSKGQYSDPILPRPLYNDSQIKCEAPIDIIPPCQPNVTITDDCFLKQNVITWSIASNGCSSDAVKINIYYAPTVDEPLKLIFSTTDLLMNFHTHTNDYQGTPSVAGCYALTAVDSFNNESIIVQKFCVDNCPEYELPNVFTPNGDGTNDLFIPLPYKFVKDIDIKIYDRWGLLMFETTNPNVLWNGTNKDTKLPCADGTYYYVCKVNEIRVEGIRSRLLKGFVQLINNK